MKNRAYIEDKVNQLLGLIRWATHQWWIKRSNSFMGGHLEHSFPLNEDGLWLDEWQRHLVQHGLFGQERALTLEMLENILVHFEAGVSIPLSFDAHFDAIHFHALNDLNRSILEEAIALEAGIGEALNFLHANGKVSKTKVKRAQDSGMKASLELLYATLGATFDRPEESLWIERTREARNCVAHTKSLPPRLLVGESGLNRETMPKVFFQRCNFLGGLKVLRGWTASRWFMNRLR